jgi:Ca-activated chloride channel homolog
MKTVALHREGDEGIIALAVVPDLGGGEPPRQDVVFVVDTSGSMAGDSIGQAQSALRLCLRHLREGDRFNLIRFSSGYKALFRGTKPFTQRMLDEADEWTQNLVADGGTEMLAPLLDAIDQVPDGVVVLLTDGQVGNEAEILADALAKRKTARIYTFGIGTNVSDALLRDLAKRSGGAAEFIHPGERIDEKVVAQFARATARRVTDVHVTWKGIEASEFAPSEPPPMVDNEPWTLYARVSGRGVGEAEIRGQLDGKPFYLAVPVDLGGAKPAPLLGKLWASERVRDLGVEGLSGRRADRMKERIVELGVKYGIATPFTSFVAIETRTGDRRASGYPETRVVPVNAPAGWDMMKQTARRRGHMMPVMANLRMSSAPMPMMADAAPPAMAAKGGGGLVGAVKAMFGGGAQPPQTTSMAVPAGAFSHRVESMPVDPITALLQAQLASGLWGPDGGRAAETAAALSQLLDAGIDTNHRVHGALIKKAIRAAVELAGSVTSDAAELLRSLAWLLSHGKRDRAAIAAELAAPPDEARLRARVRELLAVVHPH